MHVPIPNKRKVQVSPSGVKYIVCGGNPVIYQILPQDDGCMLPERMIELGIPLLIGCNSRQTFTMDKPK